MLPKGCFDRIFQSLVFLGAEDGRHEYACSRSTEAGTLSAREVSWPVNSFRSIRDAAGVQASVEIVLCSCPFSSFDLISGLLNIDVSLLEEEERDSIKRKESAVLELQALQQKLEQLTQLTKSLEETRLEPASTTLAEQNKLSVSMGYDK